MVLGIMNVTEQMFYKCGYPKELHVESGPSWEQS